MTVLRNTKQPKQTNSIPKLFVAQRGARHRYAIPLAFHRAGVLGKFYTDFGLPEFFARILSAFSVSRKVGAALSRRTIPREIRHVSSTESLSFLAQAVHKRFYRGSKNAASQPLEFMTPKNFAKLSPGITHFYSMLGEPGESLRVAREKGIITISEVYIALSSDDIVQAEALSHPDWVGADELNHSMRENHHLLNYSDLFVCPSNFVAKDLIDNHEVDSERVLVNPYPVDLRWSKLKASPRPGRVLFAGTANIRKGIHYLALASRQMDTSIEFRVAGFASETVKNHPMSDRLTFLGHLSDQEFQNELSSADVLILPSLAEGSASVTAEALGVGVPVVTTGASGSLVRDEIDGLIISERNPQAIAEAISRIVENRALRDMLSRNAKESAKSVTWDDYTDKLMAALSNVP